MVDYTDPRWNESDSQNTSPSPNGIPTGSAPSAIPAVIRNGMGAQKRTFDRGNFQGAAGGSANAYTLTYDVSPTAYAVGEVFSFFVPFTNTDVATLSINGLGAKTITQRDGSNTGPGDLVQGQPIDVTYDGTNFRMLSQAANPNFANIKVATGITIAGKKVFTTDNDGASSGLDSDLLDGQEGTWYQARANHTGTQDVSTIVGLSTLLAQLFPAGSYMSFAGSTAPVGYLVADGSAVSRTTYATLFGVIGTTYGTGDGSTTFTLPDMRGVFMRGLDKSRGIDPSRTLGSLQADAFKSHNHAVSDPGHTHGVSDPGHAHLYGASFTGSGNSSNGGYVSPGSNNVVTSTSGTGISIGGAATGVSTVVTGGTETRPQNVSVLVCIKT